ncbi:glycogen debranching protein GlgX [Lachnospiraceae bacterium OttesenSCG-928-J05]|nr:glycogen debranching protein GlgX [Lachnospiraceae bacterium OttesenSCG-928-J05]
MPNTYEQDLHMQPLDEIEGFAIRPGFYDQMGATPIPGGVCFTISSKGATACELLLFEKGEKKPYATIPYPQNYRVGDVYSMIIFNIDVEEFEYAFRLDGPYRPEEGLLFDKKNQILDPYAKAVAGQREWGVNVTYSGYKARVVKNNFFWGAYQNPQIAFNDLIIYEMHVRGFTMMDDSVEAKGTFEGLKEKIPYLKELGVNAVELMPVFEFDELRDRRVHNGKELVNYWGYNTVSFFAPNTSFAHAREYNHEGREFKQLVKALHENGIEVILDVVFNHTAEGDENGPVINFKGVDNNIYYMLTPDGHYFNFSGTGNTMNCNHPVVRRMIVDCLRYWVTSYRIDGFRFDLASILSRDENGAPLINPPLIESLAYDPILSRTKLIAEAWDAGGLYQVGSFPGHKKWSEWNGRYRDDMRSYLKGDLNAANSAANRIAGSMDIYGNDIGTHNPSINFITCHDGFTLYDLYSYNEKHNEDNGWNSTDGTDDNRSWNCGVEGETDDPEILRLRKRMIKNAAGVLMCSRGVPMFLAGDEFCNTQFGNNNPYCQDNEISWLDWSLLCKNRDIFEFFQNVIEFRKTHPVLRIELAPAISRFPDYSFYNSQGRQTTPFQAEKAFGVLFAGYDRRRRCDDIVYVLLNAFWEEQDCFFPELPEGMELYLTIDTANEEESFHHQGIKIEDRNLKIEPRTLKVFVIK